VISPPDVLCNWLTREQAWELCLQRGLPKKYVQRMGLRERMDEDAVMVLANRVISEMPQRRYSRKVAR
jgi:hypothetical protein